MSARAALTALAAGLLVVGLHPAHALTADQLRAIDARSEVELSTTGRRSGQARTVTIWFVRDGERVYVQSGKEGKTDWYRNVLASPAVTLRFGAQRLRGRARAVEDTGEAERVHGLFEQKYLSARVMGWFGGGFGHGKVVLIDELAEAP